MSLILDRPDHPPCDLTNCERDEADGNMEDLWNFNASINIPMCTFIDMPQHGAIQFWFYHY